MIYATVIINTLINGGFIISKDYPEELLNRPRKDIRGIILNQGDDGYSLDTSKVYVLKKSPKTHIVHTKGHVSGFPEIGSILNVNMEDEHVKMVVVKNKMAKAPSTIKRVVEAPRIFAYTNKFISSPDLVDQFNEFMKKKNWPEFEPEPITVVKGYHFGIKNGKSFINTLKPYNFKITDQTKETKNLKQYHTATVSTKQGKNKIVIDSVSYAKGSIARRMADQLKPVLKVHHHGMRNGYMTSLYNQKIVKPRMKNK